MNDSKIYSLKQNNIANYKSKCIKNRETISVLEKFVTSNLDYHQVKTQILRKCNLISDIYTALSDKKIDVCYQPQKDLHSGEVVGVEALMRWKHRDLGDISPYEFIPILEEINLIHTAFEWILYKSCRTVKKYSKLLSMPLRLAVNLSSCQLDNPDLCLRIKYILFALDFPPHLLTLELSESSLISNYHGAKKTIRDLKKLGVKVALDNFGTGYSSLTYLQEFPFDYVKIDKSFIGNLRDCKKKQALVQGIISIGKGLNLIVIAEGIENREDLDFLCKCDCNYGQGYIFSKPLSIKDFHSFILSKNCSTMNIN